MEDTIKILIECGFGREVLPYYRNLGTPEKVLQDFEDQLVYFTKYNPIEESADICKNIIGKLKELKIKKRLDKINKVLNKK